MNPTEIPTPRSDADKLSWDRANEAGCSYKLASQLERENVQLREALSDYLFYHGPRTPGERALEDKARAVLAATGEPK